MPSLSLPAYLISGASSRSHHALLVKLNEARSDHEEDEILDKELRRCREVLTSKGVSSVSYFRGLIVEDQMLISRQGRVAETLIVVLHCSMMGHRTQDVEWALMPALQLAEGGKTLRERRIGQSAPHPGFP